MAIEIKYSVYPFALDGTDQLPIVVDNITEVVAEVLNRHRSAIVSIESELGIDPSGTYTTVRARLDALESLIGSGGGGGSGGIEVVSEDSVPIVLNATELNFRGSSVTVTNAGSGVADINVTVNAVQEQETIAVGFLGDTAFTLSQTPIDSAAVQMFVNGQKQRYGVDYTVSGTSVSFIGSIVLDTTDEVEFWYIVDGSVSALGHVTIRDEGIDVDTDTSIINFTGSLLTASQISPGVVEVSSQLGQSQESLPVTFNGQTIFLLSSVPISNGYVQMFVNGVKQEYGVDYTNAGNIVTYSGSVSLITTDVVEFWYLANVTGATPIIYQNLAETLSIGNTTDGYDIDLTGGSAIISSDGNITLDDDVDITQDLHVFGKLTVDGLIDPPGLVLSEQATAPYDPSILGTEGLIWVRNDGYLVFTNQIGDETVLGAGGGAGTISEVQATADGVTNTDSISITGGTGPIVVIDLPNIKLDNAFGQVIIGTGTESIATLAGAIAASNTFIGASAGNVNLGTGNVVIGNTAGQNATDGTTAFNTLVGFQSGQNATNTDSCTFIGAGAGSNSSGLYNTILGQGSATQVSGTNNTVLGRSSAGFLRGGDFNVIIGSNSMHSTGGGADTSNLTGNANVIIGTVYESTGSGSNNILINGDRASANISDFLNIGDVITGDLLGGKIAINAGFSDDLSANTEALIVYGDGYFSANTTVSDSLIVTNKFEATSAEVVALGVSNERMQLASSEFNSGAVSGSGGTLTLALPAMISGNSVTYNVKVKTYTSTGNIRDFYRGIVVVYRDAVDGTVIHADNAVLDFSDPNYTVVASPPVSNIITLTFTNNSATATTNTVISASIEIEDNA